MNDAAFEKDRQDVASKAYGNVLEIGFGSGLNLAYYKNVTKLYALEPSKDLYNLAHDRLQETTFPTEYLCASAENIPLADNSIDSVVSTWTLCSIPHPEIALKEIKRVLKPQGNFVFIEHGKSPVPFIFKIQNLITPFTRRCAGGCHANRDIPKLISDAGFEIADLNAFTQKPKVLNFTYKGRAVCSK